MRFEGDEVIFVPPADPRSWEHIPFDGLDLRILNVTPVPPASLPMVLGISDIRETRQAGIKSL